MKKTVSVLMVMAALALCVGCPGPVTPTPPTPVTTHLTGNVIDAGTGEPVSGMTVSFGDQNAQTDAQGRFSLELGATEGTLLETFAVHGTGYQFLYVEEVALDSSSDWEVLIPVRRFPCAYSETVTVHGDIRTALGPEILDESTLSVYLFSTTGGSCRYPDLTYDGEYSFSTSLACNDCLLVAFVQPMGGPPFVTMARGLDLSGIVPVEQDLAEPDGGHVDISVTPDQAGNRAQCLFITEYGPVPAYFKGKGPALTWYFSSGAAASIPVFNPFGWTKAVWIQTEEDAAFPGLPQHIKDFLSAFPSASAFPGPVVLPAIDNSLGPTVGADPASLEYANGTLSLASVAGANAYAFTLRADNAEGDVLGMIWTRSASKQLPGWVMNILSGRTVHVRFEALDSGDSLFDPSFLWGGLPSGQMALGRVREGSQPYEKLITVPAGGSVEIGLE